ncbi:Biofilm operon icaADBC HTH-type negative transcriptional regulator IcaR [Acaryochloris thomasi RCC1774]|uniref:Biofilm operon icaADBC HTH-type negative transcriptional regulator IcaR n=1 Tax=Acaryochloris thomasi RCC1774 TaxID=1764569 RepID=A0A2W1JPY2_9CYAN|nr:TetR/AcrR family transcriptional regulator [Acaryochloris thomasi]PZD72184.1 Biofilm operon icaADBC HTH-type negative transcriptional regulator IcaR [Acaryochloris thomasi RCC1774]
MSKAQYIPSLLGLFRQHGYDGATLSRISEATGLGKASLYHHFPGGKSEMVATVLDYLEQETEIHILQVLRGQGEAPARLQKMCDGISRLYEQGDQPCLQAILLMGSARDVFHAKVEMLLRSWIDAIATLLMAEGLSKDIALQRAENAVLAIQGSLILSQGLNSPAVFQRVVNQLPQQLYQGLDEG